jgi:hypothetical protein
MVETNAIAMAYFKFQIALSILFHVKNGATVRGIAAPIEPARVLMNVHAMSAFGVPAQPVDANAVARAPSGGPGDRPSEQHRQIDLVLSIQIPHGVEFVAELGHSITGPLDKWANKPTTTARAATLPKIATLAP